MAFHVHRAERTDLLADGLGDLLAAPQADPFAPELVLVPAPGIERWLSQRLSHRLGRGTGADGVCAGVEFRTPRSLVADLTGTADDDPWSPDRLVWALLDTIDASAGQPWCARLAAHLGYGQRGADADLRVGRRHAVARRVAALFASYAAQRPQLLADWTDGIDSDGLGAEIDTDLAWQPELWRALIPGSRAIRRTSATPACWPRCARRVPGYRPGCRCSARPGWPPPTSSCSTPCPPIMMCTCGSRTPARPCGSVWRMCAAGCPATWPPTRTGVATPC